MGPGVPEESERDSMESARNCREGEFGGRRSSDPLPPPLSRLLCLMRHTIYSTCTHFGVWTPQTVLPQKNLMPSTFASPQAVCPELQSLPDPAAAKRFFVTAGHRPPCSSLPYLLVFMCHCHSNYVPKVERTLSFPWELMRIMRNITHFRYFNPTKSVTTMSTWVEFCGT